MKLSTECVVPDRDNPFGAISPPIYQTSTFIQPTATEFGEYDYSRTANPTRDQVEKKIAQLERGKFASAFSSGMTALAAVTKLLSVGDEIIASDDLYGGSVRLLDKVLPNCGISVKFVDTSDVDKVRAALTPATKLLLLETPTNPLLQISDISALAEIVHHNNALLAVDNTMLSPILQNPLEHGADIVIHSATKFLCGHSDVTAGAVVANDKDIYQRISFTQNAEGSGLAPFDAWLLNRGLKTLSLRVERQVENSKKIAAFLLNQRVVRDLYYPGLPGHKGKHIHAKQARGGGAVISFTTDDKELSRRIVEATRIFSIAVSFGSVNSTISLPCNMSHASIPQGLRDKLAPPSDLIRIAVGIEDAEDLIADLEQAFSSALEGSNAQAAAA